MALSTIDHIVIGAANLEKATEKVEGLLQTKFSTSGKHSLMATHNRLARLQNSAYMEIIAIDPSASFPKSCFQEQRWFSLDSPTTQRRLTTGPQPLCWVVAVNNIEQFASNCGYSPGRVTEMSRGDFRWKLTVPNNGDLSEGGILPVLIEWPKGKNPAEAMPESNLVLKQITLFHPSPDFIEPILSAMDIAGPINIKLGEPAIQFIFKTPNGNTVLFSENCLSEV
ncbi:VOC family protein [Alphaproteobacteria bacterium]|nr:VOC family protein [Alphaproteobacteria bacterium]